MKKEVKNILLVSLIINIILSAIKLISGYLGNTSSLVSDGYNSLSDVLISIMLFITIIVASKKPDKDHPYGHEKYEGIISFLLGIIVSATAVYIIYTGVVDLIKYDKNSFIVPKMFTIYVAMISIFLKIIVYQINIRGYRKYDQVSLKADAYNHLGDILATSASLLGIILSIVGLGYFDYIAAIIIGLIIIKNGYQIISESVSYLVDEAPKKEYIKQIKKTIKTVEGVISIDDFKSRKHVNKIYVDVEIGVNANLSLVEAHKIAENVHELIEKKYPDVIHCMVHVNPKQ